VKSKEFQSGAAAALKKLSANVADYDVYMGESMNNEGMYILVNFREDGVTPFATIWKHGLEEMKV
jgi:Translationally controlled tumour protein